MQEEINEINKENQELNKENQEIKKELYALKEEFKESNIKDSKLNKYLQEKK